MICFFSRWIRWIATGTASAASPARKNGSRKAIGRYRPWIIIGTFVFAAVATPSADPFSMTLMAGPMVLLFFVSEAIARINDRRKARRAPNAGLSPDELSSI